MLVAIRSPSIARRPTHLPLHNWFLWILSLCYLIARVYGLTNEAQQHYLAKCIGADIKSGQYVREGNESGLPDRCRWYVRGMIRVFLIGTDVQILMAKCIGKLSISC